MVQELSGRELEKNTEYHCGRTGYAQDIDDSHPKDKMGADRNWCPDMGHAIRAVRIFGSTPVHMRAFAMITRVTRSFLRFQPEAFSGI